MRLIPQIAWAMALATSLVLSNTRAFAQIPPSASEVELLGGLHLAAHNGDIDAIKRQLAEGANLEGRDSRQRTAIHIAAYASNEGALEVLADAGADLNAFKYQRYDIVTIAAVANDIDFLKRAIELGASAGNTTSPYAGTALIAAAHLGHHEVVKILIDAGAPLDHINNLHWTALIEAVVLGDGGPDHVETARHLVQAGADKTLGDRNGVTALEHARQRGYSNMVKVLE